MIRNRFVQIKDYILNREIDINARLTLFFVNMGIGAGFFGVLICILAHVPLAGIVSTMAVILAALLLDIYVIIRGDIELFRALIPIPVSIIVPLIYLTAGGSSGGVIVWFVYSIFFVTMSQRGRRTWIYLTLCSISQLVAFTIEYYFYDELFHFASRTDTYISVIGSVLDVGLTLAVTVYVMIKLYDEEWHLTNTREHDLELANRELESANQSQKVFLANMSHEIRTPINGILGMNELIIRETEDASIRDYSESIASSGNMLLSLVNDILDFSRIEAGKLVFSPEKYKTADAIREILLLMRPKAEDKNIDLKVVVDPNLPVGLYGDITRVKQVIINLLSNAIKYTDRGAIFLKLEKGETEGNRLKLLFSVKDTGRGIKAEDKENLFKSFERADLSKNRNIEGTGLGLAITRSIVNMMGGEISVDSVYGVGSLFSGYIVQEISSEETIGNFTEERRNTPRSSEGYSVSFTAPTASILVVDDNKLNLIVVSKLLKDTLMNVTTVESGKQAIDAIKNNKYDVILLDHMMPGMDGIDTLRTIKKEQLAVGVPVIVLTANAINGAKEKYIEEGFDDFLAKPVEGARLEAMIKRYIPEDKVNTVRENK